jgi:hypothetical protein
MGLLVRVLSNDPDQAVTLEWRSDRVNFKVDDGKVVEAWKG